MCGIRGESGVGVSSSKKLLRLLHWVKIDDGKCCWMAIYASHGGERCFRPWVLHSDKLCLGCSS